jgi:hypothetical protein
MIALGPILIWNEVIDKYFCLDIMKFGGVILGMENLKIGLLGVGALAFVAAIALQDVIAVIGSVLFTCGAALAVYVVGD